MSKPWYIDALDPVAGFCFASQRDPDLNSEDVDLDRPSIYLAPPLFQIEVAGRASAFSATHGSFQLGLLSDGVEVPFPTLAALTEFVRCCYLSGGGTDGAGGRGPVPPAPPEPDGGEGLPPRRSERTAGGDAVQQVMKTAQDFVHFAERVRDEPQAFRPSPYTAVSGKGGDRDALTNIAALLMLELLARSPRKKQEGALDQWARALARLDCALLQLGRWDAVWQSLMKSGLSEARLAALHPRPWPNLFWIHRTDAMDDLSFWPVPRALAAPEIVSVRDHLLQSTGNPKRLASELDAALALFAACHLLQAPLPNSVGDEATRQSVQSEHLRHAASWLIGQLPGYAYRPQLEDMIAKIGIYTTTGGDKDGLATFV